MLANTTQLLITIGLVIIASPLQGVEPPQSCKYYTWEWNAKTRKSVNHRLVRKDATELTKEEKDPLSKCTVCEYDQVTIKLEGTPSFRVCRHHATQIEKALKSMLDAGEKIDTVIGYRVGSSRGPIDEKGLRTLFSNHSFGTAIDINSKHNGLYKNCIEFGPKCKLSRGGKWNPENPLSITKNSTLYQAMKSIGFKWGGEIVGQQKDFMHFSLTGY